MSVSVDGNKIEFLRDVTRQDSNSEEYFIDVILYKMSDAKHATSTSDSGPTQILVTD